MTLWGLFANIRSFKNHNTFFLPTKQWHRGRKGSIFWLLKTHLNHCCQAGGTRRGAESSSGPSVSPDVPRRSSSLPLCRLGISQELSEITDCPHLPFLGRKKSSNPHKTEAIYTLISPSVPGRMSCSCLAFSESRV